MWRMTPEWCAPPAARGRLPSMETLHPTLFVDGFRYGEGPRWHEGRLWFTDGPNNTVKTVGPDGRVEVALETGHPSGLGWLPDGTLVISTLHSAQIKPPAPRAWWWPTTSATAPRPPTTSW